MNKHCTLVSMSQGPLRTKHARQRMCDEVASPPPPAQRASKERRTSGRREPAHFESPFFGSIFTRSPFPCINFAPPPSHMRSRPDKEGLENFASARLRRHSSMRPNNSFSRRYKLGICWRGGVGWGSKEYFSHQRRGAERSELRLKYVQGRRREFRNEELMLMMELIN